MLQKEKKYNTVLLPRRPRTNRVTKNNGFFLFSQFKVCKYYRTNHMFIWHRLDVFF